MRVKCANCGMIYDVNCTPMDYRTEIQRKAEAVCPDCRSNAKDVISKLEWRKND